MQVFNIRGTTSSGKSTLMRKLIASSDRNNSISLTKQVKGHEINVGIVIGPYKKGSKFGGCDAISKVQYMEEAIYRALEIRPNVFFEGLLVSHSYERWVLFSEKLRETQKLHGAKEFGMLWCFIIPSFKENLRRLKKRNAVKNLREAKGDKFILNFIERYKSIIRLYMKAVNSDQKIVELDPYNPYNTLIAAFSMYGDDKILKGVKKKGILKHT